MRRPRVLVVDDVAECRDVAFQALEDICEIQVTSSAAAARLEIERRQPDALLLDIRMPRVSGVELARSLRADPRTAHIRLLGCSADPDPAPVFDAFLAKPYRIGDLIRAVETVLGLASNP